MSTQCLLVIKLTEQSGAALDPMLDWLVAVEKNGQHKVGRMAGSRQHAPPLTRLIHRTLVSALHRPVTQHLHTR